MWIVLISASPPPPHNLYTTLTRFNLVNPHIDLEVELPSCLMLYILTEFLCYTAVMKTISSSRIFPVVVEKDEDGLFVATNTSLSGCYSQGKTIEEALVNVREATELSLEETRGNESEIRDRQVSVHLIAA